MRVEEAIKSRKSVRKFSYKKPDWRSIIECIDSMRFAPTAGKNFSMKIILVTDKSKIQKIAKASEQDFIGTADYAVVLYSEPKRILNLFGERGEIYLRHQAGAAIENFLLSIEEHGLATCWVGHFNDDEIKSILKIPDDAQIEAVFPVGYELGRASPKNKIELDKILFFNDAKTKKMKSPVKPEV
ncbi:MAG TPA: nitroreductase family protein [Candidatus Omnitrophota bacterium]|nr:nitroreductase family protein [Candidatus Omnitrophota bacterium]